LGVFETRDDLVTYYKKQGYALTGHRVKLEGAAERTEKLRLLSKRLVGSGAAAGAAPLRLAPLSAALDIFYAGQVPDRTP
jgi:hypothetical protein